jgi:hypothetical protein
MSESLYMLMLRGAFLKRVTITETHINNELDNGVFYSDKFSLDNWVF